MLVIQAGIILASVIAAIAWVTLEAPTGLGSDARQALLAAQSVAANPDIAAVESGSESTQALLAKSRKAIGALAVAVVNRHGLVEAGSGSLARGQLAAEFDGRRTWSGVLDGGSGPIAARVPIPHSAGLGIVVELSAPNPLALISGSAVRALEALAVALAIGAAGSWLASRWLRDRTFGLELDELTKLIQEQDAIFHGIREAVAGIDPKGRFQFANEEARRLLRLPARFLERPVGVLVPDGRLQAILTGEVAGKDLLVVHEDRILIANRRAVEVQGRVLGYVVTLVDRTESEALLRELDGMLGLTDALRAQAHDFSNRIHAVVGLIELGETDEAIRFATDIALRDTSLMDRLAREVGNPVIVALLLAKSAVAAERNVELRLGSSDRVPPECMPASDLVTLLGNLIDNAIDAAADGPGAWIEARFIAIGDTLTITVADSGPGVPPHLASEIFLDGFSTKLTRSGTRRGLGLALVRQLVARYRGSIEVQRDVGAVFVVRLPGVLREDAPALSDAQRS
jgi:two-component system CitB family sensor kinase